MPGLSGGPEGLDAFRDLAGVPCAGDLGDFSPDGERGCSVLRASSLDLGFESSGAVPSGRSVMMSISYVQSVGAKHVVSEISQSRYHPRTPRLPLHHLRARALVVLGIDLWLSSMLCHSVLELRHCSSRRYRLRPPPSEDCLGAMLCVLALIEYPSH